MTYPNRRNLIPFDPVCTKPAGPTSACAVAIGTCQRLQFRSAKRPKTNADGSLRPIAWATALIFAWIGCLLCNSRLIGQETISPKLTTAERVDFARDIYPILSEKCFHCHGPDVQESEYGLHMRTSALGAASSGTTPIIPGNSTESALIELVSGPDPTMPQDGEPLSAGEVNLLRQWIDEGAHWPDSANLGDRQPALWSVQPLVNADDAHGQDVEMSGNRIDSFVRAKLEQHGLSFSSQAEPRTLVRRLFLDVWGLPPDPSVVANFESNPSAEAYADLVEHVLASQHYGERWARHWLDVVRFAESHGFETNVERPTAYHYRDWVIESLNSDMSYLDFAAYQFAGDQFGQDRATGFLVGGPMDQVKSPERVLTLTQRQDELADVVNTASTAFFGLTLACARCHSHKFDPLSQTDYFAFQALFAGVQHGERPIQTEESRALELTIRELQRRRAKLRADSIESEPIAQNTPMLGADGRRLAAGLRRPINSRENVDRFPPQTVRFVRIVIHETNQFEPCLDELEVWAADSHTGALSNVALAGAGSKVSSSGDYADRSKHRIENANDGQTGNDFSWISNEAGRGWLQIELPGFQQVAAVVWGRDRTGVFTDRLALRYEIQLAAEPGQWQTVASEVDRCPTAISGGEDAAAEYQIAGNQRELEAMRAEFAKVDEELIAAQRRLSQSRMAYIGTFSTPELTHRLQRGEVTSPQELVTPDIPDVLGGLGLTDAANDAERRAALANWIRNEGHPLLARVIVNRLWQHHFGKGIVATPSDFGNKGLPPTHPELLDWLAAELINHNWSLKHIHRLILGSRTYQQSNRIRTDCAAVDADAKFLWRFPPRRLEAEAIRDSMLAVSGELDLSITAGPGFSVFEPNDNYVRVYQPKSYFGPAEFRRMIYMTRIRMEQDGTFGVFDVPDGGLNCPVRGQSTTPVQAFHLLNSPFVVGRAEAFARRVQLESGEDGNSQIERAFQFAFGRKPDASELNSVRELCEKHGLATLCRALLNTNEFIILP